MYLFIKSAHNLIEIIQASVFLFIQVAFCLVFYFKITWEYQAELNFVIDTWILILVILKEVWYGISIIFFFFLIIIELVVVA
jgi:hypothetical protein